VTGRIGRVNSARDAGGHGARHTTVAAADFFRAEIERTRITGKMNNMPNAIPLKTVKLAAAHGQVDPRTVQHVLEGRPTRPATRERALEGLLAAGVPSLTIDEIIACKGDATRRLGEVADSNARVAARTTDK
jgi:hypothetical protein